MKRWLQVLFIPIFLIATGSSVETETLYVFYPTPMTTAALQAKLSEACPGMEITVFSRLRDFEDSVRSDKPDAILTKPIIIEKIGGYVVKLKGSRKENTEEPYFLVSDKTISINQLANKSVGILDMIGKKEMDAFVGKYLNPIPELKRVSKIDDLLLLLTFNMAEGILIPEIYIKYYREKSKLNFVVSPVPNMKSGIVAVGVRQEKEAATAIKLLTALNKQYLELLEIDQWK
jgi:hypothetical protein